MFYNNIYVKWKLFLPLETIQTVRSHHYSSIIYILHNY